MKKKGFIITLIIFLIFIFSSISFAQKRRSDRINRGSRDSKIRSTASKKIKSEITPVALNMSLAFAEFVYGYNIGLRYLTPVSKNLMVGATMAYSETEFVIIGGCNLVNYELMGTVRYHNFMKNVEGRIIYLQAGGGVHFGTYLKEEESEEIPSINFGAGFVRGGVEFTFLYNVDVSSVDTMQYVTMTLGICF